MKSLALAALLLLAASANAQNSFVCAADHSVGLKFDKTTKRWKPAIFNASDKYLITRANEIQRKQGQRWEIRTIGSDSPSFTCKEEFTERGILTCEGFGEFVFNKKSNRFLTSYMMGYVYDGPDHPFGIEEGADTPSLTAGRCSATQ